MAGRPTKLTPEVRERIVQAIRGGNYRNVAARFAGISPETFARWMVNESDEACQELKAAVEEAEASAHVRALAIIQQHGQTDPRHLQWWLERKFPREWGRKDRHEVTGPEGAPLTLDVLRQAYERAGDWAGVDAGGAAETRSGPEADGSSED